MRTIQQVTTLCLLALTLTGALASAQEPKPFNQLAYEQEMRKAADLSQKRQFELALQSYKKAFSITDKTSYEACVGMALSYRGLGAHKNVVDVCADAMKLAANEPKRVASVHNMRGAALVALSDKPDDKRLLEAEREFLAALAANDKLYAAEMNLGVTLLKMNRDQEGVRVLKHYVEVAPKSGDVAGVLKMIEEPRRAREVFAPDFSFTSKQGEFIALEDLRGKTVVLDFWGTWCKPCLMATPGLVKLQKKFASQPVVFVGIAVRDQPSEWADYIDRNKMDWPQYLDTNRKIITPFSVNSYPTYIVIDAEGIVRARKSGYGSDTDGWLESEIKRTLKNK